MPLGPEVAFSYEYNDVDHVFVVIDAKIENKQYMEANRCGPHQDGFYSWNFVGPGELSSAQKVKVVDAYYDAGWDSISIINSSENKERPGLWQVTLYKRKPINVKV